MDVRISRPGLDDPGYFNYAEGAAAFFSTLKNPESLSVREVNKALDWLMGLVVVPDGEKARSYKSKVRQHLREASFNELIELIQIPEAEPDPK